MNRVALLIFTLGLSLVSVLCRAAEPNAEQTKATIEEFASKVTVNEKNSEKAEEQAGTLRRQIAEEIKTLKNHPWAGEYYYGDGLGVNVSLVLAPKSGYVFVWHGCLGRYDRNYGAVTWTNNRIRLSFTFANKRQGFQGIAEEFIPVSWGNRKYLIPSDDIVGFCNRVNGGAEPRTDVHGFYLLRAGDEKMEAKGNPLLPQEFQRYLLPHPIEADIVSVGRSTTRPSAGDWKFKDIPVILNCGKKQGLLTGMELHVTKPDSFESLIVSKVEEERCEAVMSQIGENEAGPKVGWRLSTRRP